MLPANVQYAWPHPTRRYLYVTSSDSESGLDGHVGNTHHASAFRVDPDTGALTPHGNAIALPARPIHNTVDARGEYLLTAYNLPSGLSIHRINPDATLGPEIPQAPSIDAGIYAHQVRVAPGNRLAILVTRGNDAKGDKPEDPGALKVFRFRDGLLESGVSIAPHGGYGFGPRHLDFHPTRPWVYVSLERQNKLMMFRMTDTDTAISVAPAYVRELLAAPEKVRPRQLGGTVHVHPNGRFVYVANRSYPPLDTDGHRVFDGGENGIVGFSVDPATGEPTLLEHVPTHAFHPRTFSIDPGGRLLIAAPTYTMQVRESGLVMNVPPALEIFRIGTDGRLTCARRYDMNPGRAFLWWSGMLEL